MKTLKDLFDKEDGFITIEEAKENNFCIVKNSPIIMEYDKRIRKEAIKWVRFYEMGLEDARGLKQYELEDKILAIMGFIIHFLNLEESDLQ